MILIIDDDEYSADNLCLELKRYGQLVVEGIARNGSNGKKMIDKLRPDILFLDVELPDMKGIELLEQINSCVTWNMQVIFYTAYDKYKGIVKITRNKAKAVTPLNVVGYAEGKIAYVANPTSIDVLCGNNTNYSKSVNGDGRMFVAFNSLATFGNVSYDNGISLKTF